MNSIKVDGHVRMTVGRWSGRILLLAALLMLLYKIALLITLNVGNVFLLHAVLQRNAESSRQAQLILTSLSGIGEVPAANRSLARLAWKEERFASARDYALRTLAYTPSDWQAHDLAGRAYWALGEKESARQIWQEADLIQPRLQYLGWWGWHNTVHGSAEVVIAAFEQGIDLDPNWFWGYWSLSSYYWQNSQAEKATPYFEKAAQLLPDGDPQQLFILGRLSQIKGDLVAAQQQYCTAWALDPHPSWYLQACLWTSWYLVKFDQGMQAMSQASPDLAVYYAEDWAGRFMGSGNYAQAARFYGLACQIQKPDSEACVRQKEAEVLDGFK